MNHATVTVGGRAERRRHHEHVPTSTHGVQGVVNHVLQSIPHVRRVCAGAIDGRGGGNSSSELGRRRGAVGGLPHYIAAGKVTTIKFVVLHSMHTIYR